MEELNYYAVKAICGHVGRKNYIVITFPIACKTKREAAYNVRRIPRVKHHRKDAIISVVPISCDEYQALIDKNNQDNYLKCKSRQEQNIYCLDLDNRIIPHEMDDIDYYELRQERKVFLNKKRRSEKKYNDVILKDIKQGMNGGNYGISY